MAAAPPPHHTLIWRIPCIPDTGETSPAGAAYNDCWPPVPPPHVATLPSPLCAYGGFLLLRGAEELSGQPVVGEIQWTDRVAPGAAILQVHGLVDGLMHPQQEVVGLQPVGEA